MDSVISMEYRAFEKERNILLRKIQEEIREGNIDELKNQISKEYTDLREYIAEQILGIKLNPFVSVYIEERTFPIKINLYSCSSKDGYHGGNSKTKIIKGKFIKHKSEIEEDQYKYCDVNTGLLYPEDNIAIIKEYSEWIGKNIYRVYVSNIEDIKNKMEEWNRKRNIELQKLIRDKAEKILNERIKIIGFETFSKIVEVVQNSEYYISTRSQDPKIEVYDCFKDIKLYIVFDKNKKPIFINKEYYEDCDSYKTTEISKKLKIENIQYECNIHEETEYSWEQLGYAGGNYLDKKIDKKQNCNKRDKIVIWIFETLIKSKKLKRIKFLNNKKSKIENKKWFKILFT